MSNLTKIPDYCDLMPLDKWLACAKCGGFIAYDGDGHWATEEGMDESSDVWLRNPPPKWATHVAWFNR